MYLLFAGAVLITLAYPPFHLLVPSFVCLAPAVLFIEKGNRDRLPLRRQIQYGFLFGLLSNGLLLYWLVFALWRYSHLALLGYAGTVLLLSVFCACLFAVCGWIVRSTGVSMLVAFPVLWTTLEWMQAHFGDLRFPWLGLGTSLTGFPTLVQIADIVGARGVTLLLALANTAIALAWLRRRERSRMMRLTGAVGFGIVVAITYGMVREKALEVRPIGEVVLIQPNVGAEEKWITSLQDSLVGSLLATSAIAKREADPDLFVWPEVAVPGYLEQRVDWRSRISAFARRTNTPVVTGALHAEVSLDSTLHHYNSVFVFDSAGRIDAHPIYNKQYLVPIAEQVPFIPKGMLRGRWFGSLSAGEPGSVYEMAIGRFGILICYEATFEDLARQYRVNGADFIINVTNDAWFGGTTTPYQHASHVVMRAIENRMGVARAANTGVSVFVDPLGRQYERTLLDEETYVSGAVRASRTLTLYTRLGDWVGGTTVLMALTMMAYAWWRQRLSR